MATSTKQNVLLIVGGDSAERDVSLDSSKSIFDALKGLGHRVLVADPLHPEIEPTEDPAVFFDSAAIKSEPPRLTSDRFTSRRRFIKILGRFEELRCDVVFSGLHGGAGEDGTVQAVMDYLGIAYTGSGACASAVAMNKELSKRLVSLSGVPVASQVFVQAHTGSNEAIEDEVIDKLRLPVVVKPNQEGSSVGVSVVHDREQLAGAIRRASEYGGPFLIETFVPGKEVTAAMLDGTDLPLIEIRPKVRFYDYTNKYTSGACEYLVPAPLDGDVAKAIAVSASAAYSALGCSGYARVDFRLADDGRHYFLEANTLPGMTSNSLVPKAAGKAGIDFPELVDRILRLSGTAKTL
jgi:D-alanine-D-alanine ligase